MLGWLTARTRFTWRFLTERVETEERSEPDVDDPASWLSLDYVHDQVQVQLAAQSDLWDAVDSRLRLILGVIGIVFAAAAAFLRSSPGGAAAHLPFPVGLTAVAAIMLFLLAAGIVAVVYWPTDFDRPPKPRELRDLYLTTDPREVKLTVVDTILLAYTSNQVVIRRKNVAFKVAFVLTAVATGLLGIALITQIACLTAVPVWLWQLLGRTGC